MNYNEWLRELAKLPKSAEFCLADVTERISSGASVLNFLITEAVGEDNDGESRRGRTKPVCRPRIYIGRDGAEPIDMANPTGGRIEITEPLGDVEKNFVREYAFSLHEFYLLQGRLCQSVLASLTTKIEIISERSKALLESVLGDEIVKMVTKRLTGADEEDSSLKHLLVNQISGQMARKVVQPIHRIRDESIVKLTIRDPKTDLYWEYVHENLTELILNWKGVSLHWDGTKGYVTNSIEVLCVRDTFLMMVNLSSFGELIAAKLAKIME